MQGTDRRLVNPSFTLGEYEAEKAAREAQAEATSLRRNRVRVLIAGEQHVLQVGPQTSTQGEAAYDGEHWVSFITDEGVVSFPRANLISVTQRHP